MPVIPLLRRLKQENFKFVASQDYIVRLRFKTAKTEESEWVKDLATSQ